MFCKYTKSGEFTTRSMYRGRVAERGGAGGLGGGGWGECGIGWRDRFSKIWGFIQVTEKHLYINTSKITKFF